jgi:PTS system galactitol-specific IIA component
MDDLAALVGGKDKVMLGIEAADWEAALRMGAERLRDAGCVTEGYAEAVVAREHTYPTGLPTAGAGVALPHADAEHVLEPGICVLTLRRPVHFSVMGDPDERVAVSVVFLLALADARSQLRALRLLAELVSDARRLARIAGAKDADAIVAAVAEGERAASN